MGNQASGEGFDRPWPRASGGGRGSPFALPPMVLAVEEVLWRGTSTVPEGMVSQIDIVPWIDDVQVPHGANFPPGPIWVEPRSSHSVLKLQLSPRPELGELAQRELRVELLLPFDRLVDLGAPLFTSLVLGLPLGGGPSVTINQAIQSACDPAVPKVLLTLFRPQLPWGPGGGRPHPDIQGALAADGGVGSCFGGGGGGARPADSLVEQVGGVIQAIRVANETTLHLQAASAEADEKASAAASWPATSPRGTPRSARSAGPERLSLWCYKGTDGAPLGIRVQAQVDSERTGTVLNPGEVFGVSQERRCADGVTYLLLADGRGWAFDSKPGVGLLCARQVAVGDEQDPAWTLPGPTPLGTASTASESNVFSAIAELIMSLSKRQESGKLSEAEARAREALILSQLVLQGPDMKLAGIDPGALESLRACAAELAQDLASIGGLRPKDLVQELQKVTKAKQALEVEGANRLEELRGQLASALEDLEADNKELRGQMAGAVADLEACRARERAQREQCLEEARAELRAREEDWQAELAGLQSKAKAELRAREEVWQAEVAGLQSQVADELAGREASWREELSRLVAEEQRVETELEASRGRERHLQAELECASAELRAAAEELAEERGRGQSREAEVAELRGELAGVQGEMNEMRVREKMHKALVSQMDAIERQRKLLDDEVGRLSEELWAAREKEAGQAELARLEAQGHEEHGRQHQQLQSEISFLRDRLDERGAEAVHLRRELDAQTEERAEEARLTLEELDGLRANVNEQDRRCTEQLGALEAARAEARLALGERDALTAELALAREDHASLAAARAEREGHEEALRGQLDGALADAATTRKELEAAGEELAAARELAATREAAGEEARSEASASRCEVQKLGPELESARADLEAARADLAAARSEAREEGEELRRQLDSARSGGEAMHTELLELRDRVAEQQEVEVELESHRRREKEYQDLQQEVLRKCTALNAMRHRHTDQLSPRSPLPSPVLALAAIASAAATTTTENGAAPTTSTTETRVSARGEAEACVAVEA